MVIFAAVGSSRDTCHARCEEVSGKRVAKEGAGRGRMVFKEEADGGEEEDWGVAATNRQCHCT